VNTAELRRLARDGGSEDVKKMAQGALWILEDKKSSTEDSAAVSSQGKPYLSQ